MSAKVPYKVIFHIKNNLHKTDAELAKELGRSVSSIKGLRQSRGLKKINDSKFKPGNKPKYKNTKANRGSFSKGKFPYNTLYDGCIRVRKEKGIPYKYMRVSIGVWKLLHRVVWQESNGEIPAGHIVVFRDKNTLNCEISNLEIITRAEHIRRNRNTKKAAEKLKKIWNKVKLYEANGLKHEYKFSTKYKKEKVIGINTEINKHLKF
jgi:hypothetical protein